MQTQTNAACALSHNPNDAVAHRPNGEANDLHQRTAPDLYQGAVELRPGPNHLRSVKKILEQKQQMDPAILILEALPHKCGVPARLGTPHLCGSEASKRELPSSKSQNENC